MKFHKHFQESTVNKLLNIESRDIVILRKEYGENKLWEQCSPIDAFDDILYSDRWGSDHIIEEQDSLNEFITNCEKETSWRKTERYIFRFVNFAALDNLLAEFANKIETKLSENDEDDFLSSLN